MAELPVGRGDEAVVSRLPRLRACVHLGLHADKIDCVERQPGWTIVWAMPAPHARSDKEPRMTRISSAYIGLGGVWIFILMTGVG